MTSKTIEDEVRRRYADFLAAAGISENRVATEILYWLPHEFMEQYRELFVRALALDDGAKTGGRRGDENVVRAVKKARGGKGSQRATGSGKRYVKGSWVVRDETALEVKRRVDRQLVGLIGRVKGKVMNELEGRAREGMGEEEEILQGEVRGSTPARGDIPDRGRGGDRRLVMMRGGGAKKACRTCGRIAGREWVMCPFSHL